MIPRLFTIIGLLLAAALGSAQGKAPAPWTPNGADTVWVLVSAVLVLLMTPALALFYGGLGRRKNVLNTMMMSFVALGVQTIIWLLIGYSFSFGHTDNGVVGGMAFLGGKNIAMDAPYIPAHTIPNGAFMLFQMMFAIITPALISGAVAERMKFSAYVAFISLWSIIVYAPIACWVWNPDGWLFKRGALDFAGGTVVHLASGVAALACVLALGPRKVIRREEAVHPHNIPLTLIGAGLLWVGWIGFNAGSALSAGSLAITAFMATHIAAAAGMMAWLVVDSIRGTKPSSVGAASGLVAGLVGITPAAGFVDPMGALVIGLLTGAVCSLAISLKTKLKYDDALDVVGVHGVGGALGAILTGVFATAALAPSVLEKGRLAVVGEQLLAVAVVGAFSFVASFGIMKLVGVFIPLRATEAQEDLGLDEALHGEAAYPTEGMPTEALVWTLDETSALTGAATN